MTERTTAEAWLAGRLPQDWFTGPVEVRRDRDELLILGSLSAPRVAPDAREAEHDLAARGRAKTFREETRERRIEIARELEHLSRRKDSGGAAGGGREILFTH